MFLLGQFVVGLRRKAHKSKLKNDRPIAGCWANLQQLVHLLAAAPWNLDPRVGGACRPAGPTSLIASHQSASRDEPEQIATPPALFALACTPGTRPSARAGAPREEPTTWPHVAGRRRAGPRGRSGLAWIQRPVLPRTSGARRRRRRHHIIALSSHGYGRHHSARAAH